ncbi:MAG: hypothetical protein IJ155_04890 [Prevotella sp.]|nr:hypothetical protein [Prevotella sp.]
MMKKLLVLLLLTGACVSVSAQTTKEVKGIVTDKNGTPLPGVKIEGKGENETAITDVDGTFNMEVSSKRKSLTAIYPGLMNNKKKLKENLDSLTFKMKKEEPGRWHFSALYGYHFNYSVSSLALMFGRMKNWGWYAKYIIDLSKPTGYANNGYSQSDSGYSACFGVTRKITDNIYPYVGAGFTFAYAKNTFTYGTGTYENWESSSGFMVDLGMMYRIKHIAINGGFTWRQALEGEVSTNKSSIGIQIGAGYTF